MWSGMTGKEVLQLQLNGPFNVLHERLVTVSAQEWIAREILGSLGGFTFWHAARRHCGLTRGPDGPGLPY